MINRSPEISRLFGKPSQGLRNFFGPTQQKKNRDLTLIVFTPAIPINLQFFRS